MSGSDGTPPASRSRGSNPGRGLFCVLEGIDGSGKSTLLATLSAALQDEGLGRQFGERFTGLRELREPTPGPVGRRIREHLQAGDTLAPEDWLTLFFEDRRQNLSENIEPALMSGELILQDRYFYSTAAYQGQTPDESQAIVKRSLSAGFLEPDVVLYLAIEPEAAMARVTRRAAAPNPNEVRREGEARDDAAGDSGGTAATQSKSIESFETLEQLTRIHRNYSRVLPAHALRLDAEQGPEQICAIALAHIQTVAGA
ncbi:MAG: dTMP kinase [bacterium]|nr:dTMP kinase [bacterium]